MLKERIDKKYLKQEHKQGKAKCDSSAAPDKAAAVEAKRAEIEKAAAAIDTAEAIKTVKTYKYNKAQTKNYDDFKDKLHIINKYKREAFIKKAVAKKELKFKYPVSDLIFVPDRARYNDSFKKIATNKDYNSRNVMITEDRG